ncbi:MAG TPA: TlpA disulfide reductase family protein [Candidatus Glassbacteria bacterium]|nr:TlpA disulfide reductase family protein [Candidatus Glassbacteria bacterium]
MKLTSMFRLLPVAALSCWIACGSGGPAPKDAAAQPDDAAGQRGTPAMAVAQTGDTGQAPDFSLNKLDGSAINLASYSGKVLIIDFWATWCPPCVKEIPEFVELYEAYKDRGLAILGVSVDRGGPAVVQKFVNKNKVSYDIAMGSMDVVDAYEVFTGIPTTVIIDRQGKVVDKVIGAYPKSYFEEKIKSLL